MPIDAAAGRNNVDIFLISVFAPLEGVLRQMSKCAILRWRCASSRTSIPPHTIITLSETPATIQHAPPFPPPHTSPLSTPAICSWQAKCARSTPGLPMILESIVRSSTSCASSCAWFLLPSSSRAARAVRVLLPGAGRGARWPNLLVSLGCRWLGGSKLVCPLISGYVWAAEEEFVWVNFMQIRLKTFTYHGIWAKSPM